MPFYDRRSRLTDRAACGLLALFLTLLLPSAAAQAASAEGVWATGGNRSHVQIYRCGADMCGKIVWLKSPNGADGKPARDRHNPDTAKRGQTIVGLQILSGLKPNAAGTEWSDGHIYDPENGKTFNARMSLGAGDTLKIRGYEGLPMLGQTRTWTRVK
jgi:uncharacterized protein (DUF2147 family)